MDVKKDQEQHLARKMMDLEVELFRVVILQAQLKRYVVGLRDILKHF